MKVILTVAVRDEADILDAQLAFHLAAGVDFVIATDHASADGTSDILRRYEAEGHAHVIREEGAEFLQAAWATRMARMAATDFGADWVINGDADEFWWPRGGSLKDVLSAIPQRYGLVRSFWRPFVPRPDDGRPFSERMIWRLEAQAPINDPLSVWRPNAKVLHRADTQVTVRPGNHAVEAGNLVPLRGWYPIELLHFPVRSLEQTRQKASWYHASGQTRFHDAHRDAYEALRAGHLEEHFERLVVDDEALSRGLAEGTLVEDLRLRDALGELARGASRLGFQRPELSDDARYAVEAAVLGEADIVRAQRRLDELEQRLAALERGVWQRALRRIGRA